LYVDIIRIGSSFACSNETVYGLWNTFAGGNGTIALSGSSAGDYYPGEDPPNVCDNNFGTKYTNFGACNSGSNSVSCGSNTGFYRTPQRGASLLIGLQVCTGPNLPNRDPITITFEGSNQPNASLLLGSSWTLIYNGSSGLDADPGRLTCGTTQFFRNNSIWYSSYRLLVTSKRGVDTSTWYSEVQFIGY
jgi:hypothetical protein